jgi:hypothetical protein
MSTKEITQEELEAWFKSKGLTCPINCNRLFQAIVKDCMDYIFNKRGDKWLMTEHPWTQEKIAISH